MARDKKEKEGKRPEVYGMGSKFFLDNPQINAGRSLTESFLAEKHPRIGILEDQVTALKGEQLRFLKVIEKVARGCPYTVTDKGNECPVIREINHQIDRLKGKVQ